MTTGLVDIDARILIDMVEGNAASDLRGWLARQDERWLAGIRTVTTDLAESYRSGLNPHLPHATRVADPFHVVRVANRCVDKVRRRVQQETLAHRGRKDDPLYRIRKLLLAGAERLDQRAHDRVLLGLRVGDPHDEVLGAWLAKEPTRDVYLTENVDEAAVLLDKAIAGCAEAQWNESTSASICTGGAASSCAAAPRARPSRPCASTTDPGGPGPRDRQGRPRPPEVVLEATYGWYWAADVLKLSGARVHLAHPLGNNWATGG